MGVPGARSSSTALESNNQIQKPACTCRYGTDFGVVPTLITHSQDDWFRPEQYTYERLLSLIGERPVRYPEKECAPGSDKRDSSGCHSIKEANLALIGKEWAALEPSNLTAVGVETYSDFMKVQVCIHIHRKALTKPGGIVRPVRGAISYALHAHSLAACKRLCVYDLAAAANEATPPNLLCSNSFCRRTLLLQYTMLATKGATETVKVPSFGCS